MSNSLKTIFSIILISLLMPIAVASTNELGKYLGLRKVSVSVVGTGSMYPSLFWEVEEGGPDNAENKVIEEYRTTPRMYQRFPGISVLGKTYLHRNVGIGDMVTFQNSETHAILESEGKQANSGFIKRVLAVPGDTVRLFDGYLYRNGELVDEPYIYQPRSTYGGKTLVDCVNLVIPPHKYLVLGDNRKTSADSRGELGLIDDQDISYLLPYKEQSTYHSLWRDTSHDQELIGTPTLDSSEFYRLANETRQAHGLAPLKPKTTLTNSASYKAKELLAGNSDYSLASSLAKAGYSNITTGELSIRGRFTAKELLTNILYFDSSRAELLNPDFTEIGIYDLNAEVDSCPTEVIVTHLGGYLPAEYEQETLDSWRSLVSNLQEVIPSWEKARDYDNIDHSKLEELLSIFGRRLSFAREIVGVMESREWLSVSQKAKIQADQLDSARAEQLSTELNN